MLKKREPECFYCTSMPTDQQMREGLDAMLRNALPKYRLKELGLLPRRKY